MRVEAKISVRDAYTVYASLANKNSFEKITDPASRLSTRTTNSVLGYSMHLSTNLLLLAATATGARVATHIVRFVDVNGAEQYGHVDPSEVHSLRNGVTTVELMEVRKTRR